MIPINLQHALKVRYKAKKRRRKGLENNHMTMTRNFTASLYGYLTNDAIDKAESVVIFINHAFSIDVDSKESPVQWSLHMLPQMTYDC
ncbi:CLUMA_CG014984, isoform A [Clunio marinus]|uniref:CLUMA_CG014984, isoform A n=1 Tax=Clunio marinus TaxID=568069 RepID=A0A1J1INM9_9DIPT|nr:CLUMA_CG014984, isoform A [Clunio marinus]